MNSLLICLAIIFGQVNSLHDNSLQTKPVIHLPPHKTTIDRGYGGELLELINAPTELSLPATVPTVDALGKPWLIDIKNLGPSAVTVIWKPDFNIQITPGQTVHIHANGKTYTLQR